VVVTSQNVSRGTQQQHTADSSTSVAQRTYVLDTSVLLSDPRALFRFAEHAVVLPVVVVSELEAKRNDPEIGYFARQALRLLDELRIEHERLQARRQDGLVGVVQFDAERAAVASNLKNDGLDVVVVSKDLPLRVKASSIGMAAEEYRAELAVDSGYTGIADLQVSGEQMSDLYEKEEIRSSKLDGVPVNTGVVIHSERGSALGRVHVAGAVALVRGDREVFGLRGRSAEQRLAIDALLDSEIGIVSLGGSAGTGKSALALCAGLEAVLERQQHKKIMVFRPLYAVGGQDLGFLPGDAGEKMNPWAQAVYDTLGSVVSDNVLDEVVERGLIEVLPLTHIRGRSLHDAFVIVDEAQSLERNVLLTMLSRIGQNSRVVLTHDVAQRDNLRVGRHDGIASVIERLKGHPLFAHVTLTRSERSAIAALVTDLLDSPDLV
jgi:PhoH-like ATPase